MKTSTTTPRSSGTAVVIGAGVAGLATSALLARDGWQVTVLEKNTDVGGRAGKSEPSGLRKTNQMINSLAHRTTWLRSDLIVLRKGLPRIIGHEGLQSMSRNFNLKSSNPSRKNAKSDRSHVVL